MIVRVCWLKSNCKEITEYKMVSKVDGKNVQYRLIRPVSIDQFYAILTGEEDAFYKMSMAMAVYMLGFNTYMGFGDKVRGELGDDKDGMLKRIYEYVVSV